MRMSDWSSDVCSSDLTQGRAAPVAIAPVAYDLGASVGFQKFVTPQLPRGTDIRNLPVAKAPEQEERRSRFATRMISRSSDPVAAPDPITAPGGNPSVDVGSSYPVPRHLHATAGVRHNANHPLEPLPHPR